MGSSNNRNKVLIGFGALAIVLIVAVAVWKPTFRSEEAAGAIGTVQKHHAPQIAQKDVILGDEKTRLQQNVLYTDYLSDAAKLQSIGASLAAAAASRSNVANVAQEMQNLSMELSHRYASHMTEALAEASEMASKQAGNAALASEVAELSSRLKNAKELSSSEMEQLNAKFADICEALQSKAASRLADADRELASAIEEMSSRSETAAAKLQDVEQALAARHVRNISLASRAEYFSRIQMEQKALQSAEEQLTSKEMSSKLMNVGEELANEAAQLESRAFKNIEEQLASDTEMASRLRDMDAQLASSKLASAQLANAAFNKQIAGIKQELSDRESEFRTEVASITQNELASVRQYADSRMQYAKLANGEQLQSSQLNARLANVAELQSHLAAIQKALSNSALASTLANQAELVAQVEQLESQLQARKH